MRYISPNFWHCAWTQSFAFLLLFYSSSFLVQAVSLVIYKCGCVHILYYTFIIITWPSPKAGQSLKCSQLFIFGGVEMVIGWICSRDLFETSWEGLHEALPIVIAKERRMFTCVLSLPQWRCYRNFELLVSHTNVHAKWRGSWRAFLKRNLWLRWFSLLCAHWGQVYWHNASLVHCIVRIPLPQKARLAVLLDHVNNLIRVPKYRAKWTAESKLTSTLW